MMTDPIADMFTRIRNANTKRKKTVTMPASLLKFGIAKVLKEEGYIADCAVVEAKPVSNLVLTMKYGEYGEHVITSIERISKPGRRVYTKSTEIKPVLRGMGIQVISTPKGVLSDRGARQAKLGGEILGKVS
ncbi:MAG: 30S ribosomal protein S8 [Planctomycetes bacterium]|nr:30S ribosomal protein S8 [Planctomycetota bacterium]